MTRERYKPEDNKFVSYSEVDEMAVSDAINDELGTDVPLSWVDGEPIVDSSELPDGVKMNDVRQAIKDNHPRA